MSCWGCAVATVAELRRLPGLRGCDGCDGRRAATAAGAARLRRLPMSCWGCGDAPGWGRAWSRSLPAQPKCASVSRETFVRFSIEARCDGIGRENPGGRRRSRARRRYGSARHVDRRGMFPWFHVQQKRAFGTPRCSSAFCSLKLCSKTPGRVSSSLGNAAFGLGSAVSGRVRRAKTSFLLHIALRRRANPPDGTKRRPGAARSEPRSPRVPRGARASRKIVRRSPRARATRKVCYYGQVMFSPVPPSVFERYARSRCVKTREGKQAL